MKKSTCTDLASHKAYQERMVQYKRFAVAFSYPEDKDLCLEYDRIFRQNEVWLYGSEYKIENEFQRVQDLADINSFYRAFGLETDRDRPDSLSCELEFMYYLIFKEIKAPSKEKAFICRDAQKKFFLEHLYVAAIKICRGVTSHTENEFYRRTARKLVKFLESENRLYSSPE